MQQAISTRYLGPTNARGGRVKALARKREPSFEDWPGHPEMSLTDSWNHADSIEQNHTRVAHLLATKLGWQGIWVGGHAPDGSGYLYVCIAKAAPNTRSCWSLSSHGREGVDWFLVPWAPSGA